MTQAASDKTAAVAESRRGPIATRHLLHHQPAIFEQGTPGRSGASLPPLDVPAVDPAACFGDLARRQAPGLPEVSEVDVTRHFTRLSRWNYAIDIGMYPLGSCTMKYNPRSTSAWRACRALPVCIRHSRCPARKGRWS